MIVHTLDSQLGPSRWPKRAYVRGVPLLLHGAVRVYIGAQPVGLATSTESEASNGSENEATTLIEKDL